MKVLGLDNIESFLAICTDRQRCEVVIAFLYELKHRRWANVEAFLNDYPKAEFSKLPKARFWLADNTLIIEAIVHFESGVVLLTRCVENHHHRSNSGAQMERGAA